MKQCKHRTIFKPLAIPPGHGRLVLIMLVVNFVTSSLMATFASAYKLRHLLQAAAYQITAEQIDLVQAMLPHEVYFNITLGHTYSAMTEQTTADFQSAHSIVCIRSTPVAPNTSDCSTLLATITNLHTTINVPPFHCSWMVYRSCVMYKCATKCAGFAYDTAAWAAGLEGVRGACVAGRGMSGFFQRVWGDCAQGEVPFVAGVENLGGLGVDGGGRVPPVWPCA